MPPVLGDLNLVPFEGQNSQPGFANVDGKGMGSCSLSLKFGVVELGHAWFPWSLVLPSQSHPDSFCRTMKSQDCDWATYPGWRMVTSGTQVCHPVIPSRSAPTYPSPREA